MIREKTKIRLTEADEKRFTIYDTPQEEIDGMIHNVRRTFAMMSAGIIAVLIVLVIAFIMIPNNWARMFIGFFAIVAVCMMMPNYDLYRTNVKAFLAHRHYIKVRVLETLPIENEAIRRRGYTFYPAKVHDTVRNYTSVAYLSREEYENFTPGEEKTLYVTLSKDMKNGK